MKQVRIGALTDLESIKIAVRDLENGLQEMQALFAGIEAPVNTQVIVMKADGNLALYDLISTGGTTITKDDVGAQLEIHVP